MGNRFITGDMGYNFDFSRFDYPLITFEVHQDLCPLGHDPQRDPNYPSAPGMWTNDCYHFNGHVLTVCPYCVEVVRGHSLEQCPNGWEKDWVVECCHGKSEGNPGRNYNLEIIKK